MELLLNGLWAEIHAQCSAKNSFILRDSTFEIVNFV